MRVSLNWHFQNSREYSVKNSSVWNLN